MASEQSPEARELALIDKVEFRIALTDTDSKLQSILNTYLAPLLLKLTSEHVSVRNKVISVCQHVNKRVAPGNIQLPVAALLKQFKDNPNSQLIRHFDLIYVQQGMPRLSASDRAELLPFLASGIAHMSNASAPHAAVIFNLFLRSLVESRLPPRGSPEDDKLREKLGMSADDADYITSWISKLLLFRSSSNQSASPLSSEEIDFLSVQHKPEVWDAATATGLNLTQAKVVAMNFVATAAFKDEERIIPALFASADPNSRLSGTGDGLVKQALARVDVDNDALVQKLFSVYRKSASMLSLRIKILGFMSRSKQSTLYTDDITLLADQGLVEDSGRSDREVTKLRAAIVHYLGFAARNAKSADITTIARNVVEKLKTFLDQRHADLHSLEMRSLRGKCFEIVGLLASVDSEILLEPDLSLLRWMFRSLAEESDKEVVFSIDEAISSALKPFQTRRTRELSISLKDLLVDVLSLDSINKRNTQFACLRFANRCLPFSDTTARWIDISSLASASSQNHEILEEAKKGLDPYWHWLLNINSVSGRSQNTQDEQIKPPNFIEMTQYLFKSRKADLQEPGKLLAAINFSRRCLLWACLHPNSQTLDVTADWERRMDLAVSSDQKSRDAIREQLSTIVNDDSAEEALMALFHASVDGLVSDTRSQAELTGILLDLASLSPDSVIRNLTSLAFSHPLTGTIMGNDLESRGLAARAFGIIASHPAAEQKSLSSFIESMFEVLGSRKTAIGAQINRVHGAFLALAYLISRWKLRGVNFQEADKQAHRFLPMIFDCINHSADSMLQSAAYQALSQLCMSSVLSKGALSSHMDLPAVVEKIAKDAKSGNEKAIAALGHVAMILDEESDETTLEKILDEVRGLHEIRQAETQFVVGEALTCLAFDWDSSALFANLDVTSSAPSKQRRSKVALKAIDKILQDCRTTKPAMKKASVIWLLCLIQFGSARQEIQDRLPQFQAAFKRCLSDRDDMVQESASRGLGLVYEKGSRELKDDLVRDLVASFTNNRADTSGTVTEDTQLFEPGALPTGDGSITTYKDIMSLASEVGDSSLVYRFMSLASHNAIWSSRAAFGRFGLSNVLSDSSVDGYLASNPKLYPKLYRYRFDPNSNVRRSMNDIWNALVKDPAKTTDSHFEAILDDLLINMVGREWRARQASCAAVADLIQGRDLSKIQPYTDRIWGLCFKVLDDIKDSVRGAAGELARVLTNILLNNLEGSAGKEGAIEELLGSVLTFLLSTSGLESSAKEVQAFSLHTLLEVIKKGKAKNLRRFVPDLVAQLLGLLSTFEPEAVNYVALNASNYNLQQSDIDEMRLKSIRSSPLMEAVERCLDMLDEETMKALAPKLQEALQTAVGVPTKVGFSRVLVSLSTRCNVVFRPYADGQLGAVQKRIVDRNETVSSSYAAAVGYVARLASKGQLVKTIEFARRLYFGDDATEHARFVAGEMMQAMARHATDRYKDVATETFAFVYLGQFDDEKRVRQVFKETHDETVSGPRAVALYLEEVVALASKQLSSKKWTFKHAAAVAMAESIKAVAASQGSLSEAQSELVWPSLETALKEKSWDGKERVLEGLVVFAEKGSKFLDGKKERRNEVLKIALREAKRRNKSYQAPALASLGKMASALPDMDVYEEVVALARGVMEDDDTQSDARGDARGDSGKEPHGNVARGNVEAAIEAVFGSLHAPPPRSDGAPQAYSALRINQAIELARLATANERASRAPVQLAVFGRIKELCLGLTAASKGGVDIAPADARPAIVEAMAELLALDPPAMQETPRRLRSEAWLAYAELSAVARAEASGSPLARLADMLSAERSQAIRATLSRAHQKLVAR